MRYIAGAIVVLAGALLWGSSVCAASMIYMAKGGNTGMAATASSGGMAIVVGGCVILALAHVRPAPKD
jgi:hypothetical protein